MDTNLTIGIYCNLLLIWMHVLKMRILIKKRRKVTRRWWVKPHLSIDMRQNFGAHRKLFTYFKTSNHEEFFKFTRMSVQQFDVLHDLLKPKLQKESHRTPLLTEIRIAATLRFVWRIMIPCNYIYCKS